MTEGNLRFALARLESVRIVKLIDESGRYEQILNGLLSDLKSPDTLRVILREQIAECLFWLRKHVEDKELILLEATAQKIDQGLHRFGERRTTVDDVRRVVKGDKAFLAELDSKLESASNNKVSISFDGCRAKAFEASIKAVKTADDLIQRQLLNIRHLQKSLDNIDMKRRLIKRMDLELFRLENDIDALEHEPKEDSGK